MSRISIQTKEKRFPTAPHLYGLFFEDINRSGDSGLYPEMIRNRAFEDSIPPERCTVAEDGSTFVTPEGWSDQFNGGEGLPRWVREDKIAYTPVPAWYTDGAEMALDYEDKLNAKRLVSLDVKFAPGGKVCNIGFAGVPQEKGKIYNFYMFAKAIGAAVKVTVAIESAAGKVYAEKTFNVSDASFCRYDASFAAVADDKDARLVLKSCCGGEVKFGFTSLMPADTYNGHGMRTDLMETLKAINPKFLRFPGGCIVEGFTYETAMRFPNIIGPVWERPSHILMWHYRTTNGLGYHEYLQICEDLGLEPMYVFNCGLTCQGRAPEYFEGEELQKLLQEAIDAIEYATAPADSKWGKVRAAAGHPDPFKMTYIEIGNENSGEVYNVRYKMCYDELKKRFPFIKYISNTHTERDGLPTEIADEHYYNTPEFFAENLHMFDNYPRQKDGGPEIFLGEIAANQGAACGKVYASISEAMYMIGIEHNQDIVRLASYAPLFENVHYIGWYPNLICFDNTKSYAIPTYYAWKLFGNARGKDVVKSCEETTPIYRPVKGMPSIQGSVGTRFRSPVFNGKAVKPFIEVTGYVKEENGEYVTTAPTEDQIDPRMLRFASRPGMPNPYDRAFIVLGEAADEETVNGVFEVEVFAEEGKDIGIGLFTCRPPRSVFVLDETRVPKEWDPGRLQPFAWAIANGVSTLTEGRWMRRRNVIAPADVKVNYGAWNKLRYEVTAETIKLYVNGELVQEGAVPNFQKIASVTTTTDNEVIVKIVNISATAEPVEINLDCAVCPDYEVRCFTGDPDAENSLDAPTNVCDAVCKATGASSDFTFEAPAYSINVLVLKKA